MTRTRNRSTWMWVAIAAVVFTSVARAETDLPSAKSCTHPVFQFLARSHSQNSTHAVRFINPGSRRQANSMLRSAGSGAIAAMLPVFFIGLVSPLTVLSDGSSRSLGLAPSTPPLPALFQRPPPSLA